MSDTYDRVKNNLDVADRKEMVDIILEMDIIVFWGRYKGKALFIQQCNIPDNKVKSGADDWMGKTRSILNRVNLVEKRS